MKVFADTNVFTASITDEPSRGDVATELLNEDHDFCTSILNLMEIRSVLTKKKRVEQDSLSPRISTPRWSRSMVNYWRTVPPLHPS
jgi:predicted nucleic acid-binding protein